MKMEDNFCTMDQAQVLASLGFPQDETDYCWCKSEEGTWHLLPVAELESAIECFAAPLLSDIQSFQTAATAANL